MNATNARTFVSTMPDEERSRIMNEARDLEAKGDAEGARRMRNRIPVNPKLANELKRVVGVRMLEELDCNLSDAIQVYGRQWLDDRP